MGSLVEKYQDDIRAKETELQESKKHEAVFERDRKMQEFIDEFPQLHQQETSNKMKLQNTIVALLQHISKQVAGSENMPGAQQFAEMKDELSFKATKLKNSEKTLTLLNADLAE